MGFHIQPFVKTDPPRTPTPGTILVMLEHDFRWPNGLVPYENLSLPAPQRHIIARAIRMWNSVSPVQLVERSGETDYVRFLGASGSCSSVVGRQGGAQNINCDITPGQFTEGNIMHEIGHAVGLIHEHQRPDRDDFFSVTTSNQNYKKNPSYLSPNGIPAKGVKHGAYDCFSIMHYTPNATFISLGACAAAPAGAGNFIGQRVVLSVRDRRALLSMYEQVLSFYWLSSTLVALGIA